MSCKSQLANAIYFLGKVSEVKLREVDQKYPEINNESSVNIPRIPMNTSLNNAYFIYLKSIEHDSIVKLYPSKWAKLFYDGAN